jgi:hypothetical protein
MARSLTLRSLCRDHHFSSCACNQPGSNGDYSRRALVLLCAFTFLGTLTCSQVSITRRLSVASERVSKQHDVPPGLLWLNFDELSGQE